MTELCLDLDEVRGTDLGLDEACAFVASTGVTRVEVRIPGGRQRPSPLPHAAPVDPAVLADRLRAHGLTAVSARTSLFLCPRAGSREPDWVAPEGERSALSAADHLAMLDDVIGGARALGAPAVGLGAFWREATGATSDPAAVETLRATVERVRAAGLTPVLHNDHRTAAGTGAEAAELLDAIGDPALRVAYDVAEAGRLGAWPRSGDVETVRGRLHSVRWRDQTVHVRTGWTGGRNRSSRPDDGARRSFGFWAQAAQPVSGWVGWGADAAEVSGERTLLSPGTAMGLGGARGLAGLAEGADLLCLGGDLVVWGQPASARLTRLRAAVDELEMIL